MTKYSNCILSVVVFIILSSIISCSNDDPPTGAKPPVFKKLILNPSTVGPEETVNATVEYEYPGKDIFRSDYQLTIVEVGSNSITETFEWTIIDPTKSNPVYEFKAPTKPGKYSISFHAKHINYSTGGPNGSLYGSANTVSSTLIVTEHE